MDGWMEGWMDGLTERRFWMGGKMGCASGGGQRRTKWVFNASVGVVASQDLTGGNIAQFCGCTVFSNKMWL